MKNHEIYLYGMTTYTTALLLRGEFPQANNYSEVKEKHFFPCGETGGAATILASLGCKVKIDGNHMGYNTDKAVRRFYEEIGVDVSRLHFDPDYAGVDEIIIIDKDTRTIFGQYAALYVDCHQKTIKRWNNPLEKDIKGIKAAGIDPFGEESIMAARFCYANNVPFVTIDSGHEHTICKSASIIVVSSDWIRDNMPDYCNDKGKTELLKKYMDCTDALVIFTNGGGESIYGRNGKIGKFNAHKVDVVSTLGAGDTFKAGCIYGLSQGWKDEKIIGFSNALAAIACTKFPLPFNPPTLEEVEKFMNNSR
ncbi:MAG: carbohydrate kinase family protein [Defluviitaleaceae bacterium]|nr:carbohydrate kinase family protein [Defluviitaleaceae bacterium]